MKEPFTKERAAHLLEEVLKCLREMESGEVRRGLNDILPLIAAGKFGEFSLPLFRQVLQIIGDMDEQEREFFLNSLPREIQKARLSHADSLDLLREIGAMGETLEEEGAMLTNLNILLSSLELQPEEREELRREAEKEQERLRSSATIKRERQWELALLAHRLEEADLREDFWKFLEALVEALPKVEGEEARLGYIISIMVDLQGQYGDERAEIILSKLLDQSAELGPISRETLLEFVAEETATAGIKGSSPIFPRLLEMTKRMVEEGETREDMLPIIIMRIVRSGVELSLIEKWLAECRKSGEEHFLIPCIESFYEIRSLCEEEKFEEALEKAEEVTAFPADALFLIASSIVRKIAR